MIYTCWSSLYTRHTSLLTTDYKQMPVRYRWQRPKQTVFLIWKIYSQNHISDKHFVKQVQNKAYKPKPDYRKYFRISGRNAARPSAVVGSVNLELNSYYCKSGNDASKLCRLYSTSVWNCSANTSNCFPEVENLFVVALGLSKIFNHMIVHN